MSSINGSVGLRINIALAERDAVKLILDFLQQRELYISMLDIERETGIINSSYSEDILFLRQLILDGQWDDVIDFIQPLKTIESFDAKLFIYLILKHQFLELLCLKTEAQIENDLSVEQIVKFLNDLRPFAPDEQEYKNLSFLLTLKRLQDHNDYHNWNPSTGRIQCFHEVLPLVHRYLKTDKQTTSIAQGDRLIQLLIKGLLYESCVEHCQARATNTNETIDLTNTNCLLTNARLSDTDVSLLSWLHSLPTETFSCPFEQKSLKLNIEKLQKPTLEASWAEHVLTTPFKPQTMFPFNATPTGKPRSTELMSRSLVSQYDGLSYGLIRSQVFGDNHRQSTTDMSHSLAVCNLKDHRTNSTNATILPTVQEVLHEETPSLSTPPRTTSPNFINRISPEISHRSQSSKQKNLTNKQINSTVTNHHYHHQLLTKELPADCLLKEYQRGQREIIKHFDEQETELEKQFSTIPKIREMDHTTKCGSIENIIHLPAFIPLVSITDVQAIRSVDIHPNGKYFVIGSNSKLLRICSYPDTKNIRTDSIPSPAKVLYQKGKHHLGSIYCVGWSPSGKIIATGSNDKLIKLVRIDMDQPGDTLNNTEIALTHHNGTIRDLVFMQEDLQDDSILLSGGAGDCKIYVTDIKKQIPIKTYSGHQGHIYSLYTWDACNIVSASQDGTSRLWDIRQDNCIDVIAPHSLNSPVASVTVDNSGQLLAAGYEDASCLLYDLRGKRVVQIYQPHSDEIRSTRFSIHSYYLLTASYDKKVVMTNLNGDLTQPLVLSSVAAHTDKIIQARWHPHDVSFATTSADRTCIVWAPPLSVSSHLVQSS